MVNTFLVDPDFRLSAKCLDYRRLGKQRVEAYQILTALKQLRFLAQFFGLPDFPSDEDRSREERTTWIRQVLSAYKASGIKYIHIRQQIIIISYMDRKPRRIKSNHQLVWDTSGQIWEVVGKRQRVISSGHWSEYVLPGEELITTGFRYHPAVCMWLGFETALEQYINAHIHEWIARGYQNNMKTYPSLKEYARPAWSYSDKVIHSYRAILMQKEIDRKESAWYLLQNIFIEAWSYTEFRNYMYQVKAYLKNINSKLWPEFISPDMLLCLGEASPFDWP